MKPHIMHITCHSNANVVKNAISHEKDSLLIATHRTCEGIRLGFKDLKKIFALYKQYIDLVFICTPNP